MPNACTDWPAGMKRHDVFALGRSEYNDFLFADVGAMTHGPALTVLSVFARIGRDPWQEANRLARLSQREAANSLAHSIVTMPDSGWTMVDAWPLADRVTSLLPAPNDVMVVPRGGMIAAGLSYGRAALLLLRRAVGL